MKYKKHLETSEAPLSPKQFCAMQLDYDVSNGAKQEFKDECNINFILKNYQKTGVITHLSDKLPMFGNVEDVDLQEAMNTMIEAENVFMKLPAKLRKEFDNDPVKFIEAAQSQDKNEILDKYGMYDKPKPEVIRKVEVVNTKNSANNDDLTTKNAE